MTVKNRTVFIKFRLFGTLLIISLLALLLGKLYAAGFDLNLIEIKAAEMLSVLLLSAVFAYQSNKIKYQVDQIENIEGFLRWLDAYFEKFMGEVIYKDDELIIFEVKEKPTGIFSKSNCSYYKVSLQKGSATIEGPYYKKPKAVQY